jgi:phospholipid transport system substrate-binding protein
MTPIISIGRYVGFVLFAALVATQALGVHVHAAETEDGAQSALDVVREAVRRVHAVVDGIPDGERQRVEVRHLAETLFDFEGMSQRMLARHWSDGSPQQQAEFVHLLGDLLQRTCVDVIAGGGWVGTTFAGGSVDGQYARVRSRVGMDRGPGIAIDYQLSRHGERWAVYDVLHDGASLVANYRSQFNSILRTSSFAQLLERMRGGEAQPPMAGESIEDLGRRLLLFSVVMERGTR